MAGKGAYSPPPGWISWWLVISSILMTYDAGYVLLRPRSLPGGDLYPIWAPYKLYAATDRLYSGEVLAAGDGFCAGQSLMNLVEVTAQLLCVWMWRASSREAGGAQRADLLCFACQLCTWWKTVLYWLNDLMRPEGQRYTDTEQPLHTFILVYIIPNGFWLVVPLLVVLTLGARILSVLPKRAGTSASAAGPGGDVTTRSRVTKAE